jgi:hypothetical protein
MDGSSQTKKKGKICKIRQGKEPNVNIVSMSSQLNLNANVEKQTTVRRSANTKI